MEKGSHNMLYRVFEGERWSAVGVGESGFEFVEVGGAVPVEERAKITNRKKKSEDYVKEPHPLRSNEVTWRAGESSVCIPLHITIT